MTGLEIALVIAAVWGIIVAAALTLARAAGRPVPRPRNHDDEMPQERGEPRR